MDRSKLPLYAILVIYVAYSLTGIDSPWSMGHHGCVGGEKSRPAIYYLDLGYTTTKLGQVASKDPSMCVTSLDYNVDHPAGLPLLISLSFQAFGISEAAARATIVVSNIAMICFFYLFVKEYWNNKLAFLATLTMVITPMFFYIRSFTSTEVFSMMFICGLLYMYVKWLKTGSEKLFWTSVVFFFIGAVFSDWWVYPVPFLMMAHSWLSKKPKKFRKLLIFIPIAALAMAVYIGHMWLLTGSLIGNGSHWGSLLDRLLFRLNLDQASQQYNITPLALTKAILESCMRYYNPLLFSLAVIYIATTLVRIRKGVDERDLLVVLLFAMAVAILYAFSNITWIHDFFVLFFLPSVSLAAASVMARALGSGKRSVVFYIILLLIVAASSYGTYKDIYSWSTTSDDLVKFMHDHDGSFIFTFNESPDYQQFGFYTDWRNIACADSISQMNGIDFTKFNYIVTSAGGTDASLASYLESKFGARSQIIYNAYTNQNYTVYLV
ncbi:MAG: glycosyltransferase family 39 protein [Candidatus Aenigmarchaeota archaeon]|nr:glycosyltransferase family 39 protein [Candidatus Aenigmarchaeota archaeon]